MDHWRDIQTQYRQLVEESFAPLPILDVPLFDREVVGLDMLRRMGETLFAEHDPTARLYAGPERRVQEAEGGYTLQIPLPMAQGKVQLTRTSSDEVIVHIGNRKHILSLPHTLAGMQIGKAHHKQSTLLIDFYWAQQASVER